MKKVLLLVAFLAIGVCASSYAQELTDAQKQEYQEYQDFLNRTNQRAIKKQKLIDVQHGHHFGVAYSCTPIVNLDGGLNNGILLSYGNRLSEHWMLGVLAGADIISPSEISYINNDTDRVEWIERPVVSFPIMAEVRLYFGTSRVMPYWVTDIGASVSKYTGTIFNTGLGLDINFKDSHTIYIQAGIGTCPIAGVPDTFGLGFDEEQSLRKIQTFAANLRLGYYI